MEIHKNIQLIQLDSIPSLGYFFNTQVICTEIHQNEYDKEVTKNYGFHKTDSPIR